MTTLPKPMKLPNDLIGVAGVHFVAMELALRGLIALPTVRNTAGIDLLVSEPAGRGQASLQVKTSLTLVKFWPTSTPARCIKGPHAFFVFLRYLATEKRFEAFLESGDDVAAQVERNLEGRRQRGRSLFPYWAVPSEDGALERLREQWQMWRPPSF